MNKLIPLKIQLFAAGPTMSTDMVIPQVWADMISAKLPAALKFTKFAKVDNTLVGRPGDTISVPKYDYIGDAEDVAEGTAITPVKLTKQVKVYQLQMKLSYHHTEILKQKDNANY